MSITYNGVAGNVTARANPSTTNPADGDGLTAASVNAALQALTDQAAFMQSKAVLIGLSNSAAAGVNVIQAQAAGSGHGGQFIGGSGGGHGVQATGGGTFFGVDATGGSSGGFGVRGIAGSAAGVGVQAQGINSSGARAAFNLVSQPSAGSTGMQPGDLFWDGTNLRFCKSAGTSVIVI